MRGIELWTVSLAVLAILYQPSAATASAEWSPWSVWDKTCSRSCGGTVGAILKRTRTCTYPAPAPGDPTCVGPYEEIKPSKCDQQPCPVDGGVGDWSVWKVATCSKTCGGGHGFLFRFRYCDNPAPQYGGDDCKNSTMDFKMGLCVDTPCPVDGGMSEWVNEDTVCPVTCGAGVMLQKRTRSCSNPHPQFGGKPCNGKVEEYVPVLCRLQPCSDNYGLSLWSPWMESSCDGMCGENITTSAMRTRGCSDSECSDELIDSQDKPCPYRPCPVHGGLSDWSAWTGDECQTTCGKSHFKLSMRSRTCDQPVPQFGGLPCIGETSMEKVDTCQLPECLGIGQWASWQEWSMPNCSRTCGYLESGPSTRLRSCQSTNLTCIGQNLQSKLAPCELQVCPTDGGFTQWSEWKSMPCDITCGKEGRSERYRTRSCRNPVPSHGGLDCDGPRYEMREGSCKPDPCPIHGGFDHWKEWDDPPCSATCGRGHRTLTRVRTCSKPHPQYGGGNCTGPYTDNEVRKCVATLSDCQTTGVTMTGVIVGVTVTFIVIVIFVVVAICCFRKRDRKSDTVSLAGSLTRDSLSFSETIRGSLNIEDFKSEEEKGLKDSGLEWNQPFSKKHKINVWNPENYSKPMNDSLMF